MSAHCEPILIENGTLLLDDGRRLSASTGWLAVAGGQIAALGAGEAPEEWRARAGRAVDAANMVVLPGLLNGHTHFSQTFLRGLADDLPLLRWLKEIIWPAQAAMTPEDMYLAALLGLVENLRCGVTAVVQHHKLPGRAHVDAACRAATEVGLHMTLARGWTDLGASGEPPDVILAELQWLHETWGDRIGIASGPMAPGRCSDETMRRVTGLVRSWGARTHIHCAESRGETVVMRARTGQGHVEWLAGLGCLGPDTDLIHTIHVGDAELDMIAEAGATVVHCPTSNMYLASGTAPVRAMLDRGIRVTLGTDGPGSNNSQDLLECAKVACLLAKHATGKAQALLPADAVRMMTGGSDGAGRGRLAAGAPADITIVNLDNARCQPVHNAASALVYNAAGPDVHTVIAGGRILLDAGKVTMLDEAELLERCRRAAAALIRRAHLSLERDDAGR